MATDVFDVNDAERRESFFGPIGHGEWHRTHYKHTHHHLRQFGLIESGNEEATEMAEQRVIADVAQKRFENPDEVRVFEKGRLEVVRIGPLVLGRATYEPGWKWSLHVGAMAGARHCVVEHVGMVVSGVVTVAFEDGRVVELREEGSLFHVPAVPHDSWVVGDRPYVSLHFMGAEHYAR